MAIFVIFNVSEPDKANAAVLEHFGDDCLKISNNEFLVAAPMTAREVSDKLQFSDGQNGSAIVFAMSGYYGRASSNIWEWIRTKTEKSGG